MERPKSAKHNIERFKKSLMKRNLTLADPFANDENDGERDLASSSELRARKEQRKLASKSAYAGQPLNVSTRPQSARHNLDKYRHDVMIEKLREQQQHESPKKHLASSCQEHKLKNIENFEDVSSTNMNVSGQTALVEDNLDSLDGLLIREEDDDSSSQSDELDSQASMTEMITHHHQQQQLQQPPQPPSVANKFYNQKTHSSQVKQVNSKQKLLERRGAPNNGHGLKGQKKFSHQLPLSTASNRFDHSSSILVAQKLKEQQQVQHMNVSNVISLHPQHAGTLDDEEFDEDTDKVGVHAENVPCTTNSSSSSSTSSQQLSTTLNGPKEDLLHLNNACEEEIVILENRSKAPINMLTDLVSQKLLSEWNRNDDEVELTIEKLNEFDTNNNKNGYNEYRSQQKPPYNGTGHNRRQHQHSRNSNQSQKQQIILLNNAGRTSRFSDQSSSTVNNSSFYPTSTKASNVNTHGSSNNKALNATNLVSHNQQTLLNREKSSNSMDPWARRNPTLVAQNVLLKHRSELEQMHGNRQNGNVTTASMLATTNKYLLPDGKYLKKNSNNY